jgi:hypothetical protein
MSDLDNRLAGEEPEPIDQFESPAEIYAYVHKKCGEGALRDLLARPLKGVTRTREDLLDDAGELKGAGLSQVATIVTELAAAALPMTDMSFCRYTSDVPANVAAWLRSMQRRQVERQLAREQKFKNKPTSKL